MARLRRADCSGPGITRRRVGRGFAYYDDDGERVDEREVLQRIRELGIPPAWQEVWICPYPNGHLQATGIDAAGRKQYRYHDAWRTRRDAEKFEDMMRFARALPRLREQVEADLAAADGLTRERVLACAVRLLDRGFFRIGTEEYAVTNESYGLATIRKEHVTIEPDGTMVFDYPGQERQAAHPGRRRPAGQRDRRRAQAPPRRRARPAGLQGRPTLGGRALGRHQRLSQGRDRRRLLGQGLPDLERHRDRRRWRSRSPAPAHGAPTSRKRAITRAIKETSHYLGNTPAVCRASYIDPRVFDAYRGGLVLDQDVIAEALDAAPGDLPTHHPAIERAVLDLLDEREAPGVEKLAA